MIVTATISTAAPPATDEIAVKEGFEEALPDLHSYNAKYSWSTDNARSGKKSLHITPNQQGGAYFKLDGLIDFTSDYEYSFWVKHDTNVNVRGYISGSSGKRRFTISHARKGDQTQEWYQIRGTVRAKEWRADAKQVMMAMSANGECWVDDVVIRKAVVPDPPLEVWPKLAQNLHDMAAKNICHLKRGASVKLTARHATLAPTIHQAQALAVSTDVVTIPAEGLLTFAVEAAEDIYVDGTLWLEPDANLQPGLRAYVLANDTLIAAPMVRAEPWRNTQGGKSTAPAPRLHGVKPQTEVRLCQFRLTKGRHTITVAGPHLRPAGRFQRLELHAQERTPLNPIYSFAFITDTHLGNGRPEWMNVKMDEPAIEELGNTLSQLKAEGVAFAVHGGDMIDTGTAAQTDYLADAVRRGGLPLYGAIGNHEVFTPNSRPALLAQIPEVFPHGDTQYAFAKPPLRFVVLDGAWWHDHDGQPMLAYNRATAKRMYPRQSDFAWLKKTLADDPTTPTITVWHFPAYNTRGVASSGYKLGDPLIWHQETLDLLESTPNVVAALNGHMHYNSAEVHNRIAYLQNAAYAEWPHLYRVLRVYDKHVEWEVRQVSNRGFVSEGFLPAKALSWMVSVTEGDLAGEFKLSKGSH